MYLDIRSMAQAVFWMVAGILICWYSAGCPAEACRPEEDASFNLREVIIGTCERFQADHQDVFCPDRFRNCTDIWEAFSGAFRQQPRCNVNESRYDRYVQLTATDLPKDKAVFWENVYHFVSRFTNGGRHYFQVGDTLMGYIPDGLQWCGSLNESDITPGGSKCPSSWEASSHCPQGASRACWVAISKYFAQHVSGEIYVMLNTSVTPIYAIDTYLAEYEIPYLRSGVVTKATALLLNDSPEPGKSQCSDGSLSVLEGQLRQKNISYMCVENRRDVATIYCLDNPTAKLCDSLAHATNSAPTIVG
ncbi:ADP-ribosyl cyclase/cyclic ADP-ribose hydrolase 2-like isoform X1 [Dreissena polymorpha]|nr:ADP-ribosyl cyclase/cyclic ADP-ribose hydrolase 2-like isoform X1 [Dreissena polymorpha]